MAIPYTAPTLTGYNSNPPSDDGTASGANALKWSAHKDKLADPLKTYIAAISNELDSAFTFLPDQSRTQAEIDAGVTPTNYQYEPGDLRRMGAALDGTTDDTTAFQDTLDSAGFVLPWDGTLLIDSVTTTKQVNIRGHWTRSIIKLATPSTAYTSGIIFDHAGSSIEGVHINGNDTERSLVEVNADDCVVDITSEKVNAGASSTGEQSGIEINSANNVRFRIYGTDYDNTGRSNDSIPRLVTIQGTSDNYIGDVVSGLEVNCGVVIGSSTGQGNMDRIILEDADDNGLYALGGDVAVGTLEYNGNEEAYVTTGGRVRIDKIVCKDQVTAAIGFNANDTAAETHVGHIDMQCPAATGGSIIRSRAGNTAYGKINVGRITGTLRGETIFLITTGTLERLTIHDVDLEFVYDAAVATAITSWGSMAGSKSFDLRSWHIKIVDEDDVLTGSDFFRIVAPSTNLTYKSFWEDIRIELTDADGTTVSAGGFRGTGMAKDLIYVQGAQWQVNAGPYIKETDYGNGVPDSANVSPTTGTWRTGKYLANQAPATDGNNMNLRGWICTAGGTSGSWAPQYVSTVSPAT